MQHDKMKQKNLNPNAVMNSVVHKLDQIVHLEDDAIMLAHLEEIISRKKGMIVKREKENLESLKYVCCQNTDNLRTAKRN
jgi:hypothetical protein